MSPWPSEAKLQDREILLQLVQESSEYYASTPLFLQRDKITDEQIDEYISDDGVFIVWQEDQAVGFIHANVSDQDDMINLTLNQNGLINTLGAYINPIFVINGLVKTCYMRLSITCDSLKLSLFMLILKLQIFLPISLG